LVIIDEPDETIAVNEGEVLNITAVENELPEGRSYDEPGD
jgi:hypothetical protein